MLIMYWPITAESGYVSKPQTTNRAVIKRGGGGFSLATIYHEYGLRLRSYENNGRNIALKEIPGCFIPRQLVELTGNLKS